ncbi:MAG TPA: NAD(P)/FAD-dependent oxidoreductase [Leptolyngbyaceae cyanobacterium M65_K2018_010]|nr:NAD(P)/FAD-dependent oxidoreductase [Leptolyngbyaceae cyanobacterium M65_K2018_010]
MAPIDDVSERAGEATAGPRVCILGGGFGGLYCALALQRYQRRLSVPLRVTLVEPRDRFTFTPLLYEVLSGELQPWQVAPPYRDLFNHSPIELCQDWVEGIDLHQRRVTLRQGPTLAYDYLVVALGSRLRPPASPDSPGALPFTNLADVWQLEHRLAALEHQSSGDPMHLVVAGAGPSGVELACTLADRLGGRARITVLDRRAAVLRSYPPAMQRAAIRALAKRGVEVYTHAPLQSVEENHVVFHHQGQGHRRRADLTLWTVGTVPQPWVGQPRPKQTPLAQCLVRPTLQLPDYDNVFVLGDMAAMPARGRDCAPMTAQAAFQAAPVVAHNLWALTTAHPLRTFHYRHLGDMLSLGRGDAVVHGFGLCLTGRLGSVSRRWAYWLRLPTRRHRWRVLKHWASLT